jgi:hypothetical protein
MAIRILTGTPADIAGIQPTVTALYGFPKPAEDIFAAPPTGGRAIVIGDPPAFCRLVHRQLDVREVTLLPPALQTILNASTRWSTQVFEFGPLSASTPAITAALLPHLATALAAIVSKAPSNIRATLNGRPVFAAFGGVVTQADAAALVAQMKLAFPAAQTAGAYIWHSKLSDAAAAVSGSAVVV